MASTTTKVTGGLAAVAALAVGAYVGLSGPGDTRVTFTVSPSQVASDGAPVATWSSENAVSCVAGGGWSGSKPVSGTETLPKINNTALTAQKVTYTLTCTGAPVDSKDVKVSWSPTTTYTDNTTLKAGDLGGYLILYGQSNRFDKQAKIDVTAANPNPTTYTLTALPAGTYQLKMRSFLSLATGTNYAQSADSAIVSTTVVGTPAQVVTATQEATFAPPVVVPPNPPTNITVQDPLVWRVDQALDAVRLVNVGTIPLGTACDKTVTMMGYYRVPRDKVVVKSGQLRPNVALAKCG